MRLTSGVALLPLILALALTSCTPGAALSEPETSEASAVNPPSSVIEEPERPVTDDGEQTNMCVDELRDSGYGSRPGYDIDSVTISKTSTTFTYTFSGSGGGSGHNLGLKVDLWPTSGHDGGIFFTTHLGGGTKVTVNAWTAAGGDNYITNVAEVTREGPEITTTIPLFYLEEAGLHENFEWSAFAVYDRNLKDWCPGRDSESLLRSDF